MKRLGAERLDLVDQIFGYLKRGVSVHLVGLRSSGRTAAMRNVKTLLEEAGRPTVHLRGIKAIADRPLGALALAGIGNAAPQGQLQIMGAVVEALTKKLGSAKAVLLIDDVDDLDPVSLGAVVAVHAELGMPIMMSRRPGYNGGAQTGPLQPAVLFECAPLAFEEVHCLVHQILDDSVSPTAVAQIAALSGGLPGLVEAIIESALIANTLVKRRGMWLVRGELWDAGLVATVTSLLEDLDQNGMDALTALALGGVMSLEEARHMVSTEQLAALDDLGLVQMVRVEQCQELAVFPPILSDYFTHGRSLAHLLAAQERLAQVKQHLTEQAAPCALHPWPMAPDEVKTGSSILARAMTRHWVDQEARARGVWRTEPFPRQAAHLLEAMVFMNAKPFELNEVINLTQTEAATPHDLAEFQVWVTLAKLPWRPQEPGQDALLTKPADNLPFTKSVHTFHSIMTESAHPDPSQTQQPELDQDLQACEAWRLALAGQSRAALAAADRAGFTPDQTGPWSLLADLARELALILDCRLDQAIDLAMISLAKSRDGQSIGGIQAHAYMACLALALRGRVTESLALTSQALALAPTPPHFACFQNGLLGLAAAAAQVEGRSAYAESMVRQSVGLANWDGPLPYTSPDLIPALATLHQDQSDANALWHKAEVRLERGYLTGAIWGGVMAVEHHPDQDRAEALGALLEQTDSKLLTLLVEYAQALASDSIEQLAAIVTPLRQAGLRLHAVHASVSNAILLRRAGQRVEAAQLARQVWDQTGLRGRDLVGLFMPYDREIKLSSRERQIAALVALGRSSASIAAEMVLSTRTVENHIFNACQKIGVDNREALGQAARTWLSLNPQQVIGE